MASRESWYSPSCPSRSKKAPPNAPPVMRRVFSVPSAYCWGVTFSGVPAVVYQYKAFLGTRVNESPVLRSLGNVVASVVVPNQMSRSPTRTLPSSSLAEKMAVLPSVSVSQVLPPSRDALKVGVPEAVPSTTSMVYSFESEPS